MLLGDLLFAPLCLGCARALQGRSAFCFACARFFLSFRANENYLFPHEGPGKGFIVSLRGWSPERAAAWATEIARRRGRLHAWREQGYDLLVQAAQNQKSAASGLALFAERAARETGAVYLPRLFRKKSFCTQHGKSLVARMDTPCFVELARPEAWVRGKQVLVVDDVYTTGTTLDLCAYVLRKAGASRVSRFSIARQLPAAAPQRSA